MIPEHPVYVISKGRFENCLTAKFLLADRVPFKLVVEPQEFEEYSKRYGKENILELPFSNLGLGSIPARNFCWEHSKTLNASHHWILDDNIRHIHRRYKAKRIRCRSGIAFKYIEHFVSRYENIGIAGMNYSKFIPDKIKIAPFFLNTHIYSCLLILNSLPFRWRGRYNEDTDLCLQVLSSNLCIINFNAFTIEKMATMQMKGGNTESLYQGDGRLKMARSLQRQWPYAVTVDRRFKRPQHIVANNWRNFNTKLIKKKHQPPPLKVNWKVTTLAEVQSTKLKHLLGLDDVTSKIT